MLPIKHEYLKPSQEQMAWLQQHDSRVKISGVERLVPLHSYFKMKLAGTANEMFTRESVFLKLQEALSLVPSEYSFLIFDAFRTKETQKAIFDVIYLEQQKLHPDYPPEKIKEITLQFVADPSDPTRFPVLPHNSGGAIDLTLAKEGVRLDLGTQFDEVSPLSATDFFEQDYSSEHGLSQQKWHEVRDNRRLLFNCLKQVGFSNYHEEWWHYDLGTCFWKKALNVEWMYDALEK